MKLNSTRAALLAATLLALPAGVLAQTEQQRLAEAMAMQRGVHSQDAAGNLDEAIAIFREVAGPRTVDRALAAEAQYRLSQALLQKGDLTGASEAMMLLSTNFPDQAERIRQIVGGTAGQGLVTLRFTEAGAAGGGGGRGRGAGVAGAAAVAPNATLEQLRELERAMSELALARGESFQTIYDRDFVAGGTRSVSTTVEAMSWTNPTSWLRIADGATRWNLILPSPNMLLRLGMNRESLPVGLQISVVWTADATNTPLADGSMLGRVESVVRQSDGTMVFDRAAMLAQEEAARQAAQAERAAQQAQ